MLPYARLNIPHELIQHRLWQYVKSSGLVETGDFFNSVSAKTINKAIPELQPLFKKHGLTDLRGVALIRCVPNTIDKVRPHVDVLPDAATNPIKRSVAVNWPIFNCKNTYTAFYKPHPSLQNKVNIDILPNGLPYDKFSLSEVIETHRIEITGPTALRFDVIHAAINETLMDRWTASFRFDSNHWELFENDIHNG